MYWNYYYWGMHLFWWIFWVALVVVLARSTRPSTTSGWPSSVAEDVATARPTPPCDRVRGPDRYGGVGARPFWAARQNVVDRRHPPTPSTWRPPHHRGQNISEPAPIVKEMAVVALVVKLAFAVVTSLIAAWTADMRAAKVVALMAFVMSVFADCRLV